MSFTQTSTLNSKKLNFDSRITTDVNNVVLDNVQFQPIYESFNAPGDDTRTNVDSIGFQITKYVSNLDHEGVVVDTSVQWTDLYTHNTFINGNVSNPLHAINKSFFDSNTIKLINNQSTNQNFYDNILKKENISSNGFENRYIFTMNVDYIDNNSFEHGNVSFTINDIILLSEFQTNSDNIEYNGIFMVDSIIEHTSNVQIILDKLSGSTVIQNNQTNISGGTSGVVFLDGEYNITENTEYLSYDFVKNENTYFDQSNINIGTILTDNGYNQLSSDNNALTTWIVTATDNQENVEGNTISALKYTGTIAVQDYDNVRVTGGNITTLTHLSAAYSHSKGIPQFTVDGDTGSCTAVNFTANSDARLKENVEPIQNALHLVHKLDGKTFDWINKPSVNKSYGFIAQEIEKHFPSLVETSSSGNNLKSVDYMKVTAILVEAIKELYLEISNLKNELLTK